MNISIYLHPYINNLIYYMIYLFLDKLIFGTSGIIWLSVCLPVDNPRERVFVPLSQGSGSTDFD